MFNSAVTQVKMVQFRPFAGWRFDLSQVGSLAEVTCPLPEAIGESLQRSLYQRHPCNVVRLVANRTEPGDSSADDRSQRAADFFHTWRREGILLREHDEAFYVCELVPPPQSGAQSQWGVFGLLRLPGGGIDPSSAAPETDICRADNDAAGIHATAAEQCQLVGQLEANVAPVIGIVAEDWQSSDTLADLLQRLIPGITPIQLVDDGMDDGNDSPHSGSAVRIWPVTDRERRNELQEFLTYGAVTVVGGKQQFQASVDHFSHVSRLTQENGNALAENDPQRFVMTFLTGSQDPAAEFRASGRAIRCGSLAADVATGPDAASAVRQRIGTQLTLIPVGSEASAAADAMELAALHEQQPALAVGFSDGSWWIATDIPSSSDNCPEGGVAHLALTATDSGAEFQQVPITADSIQAAAELHRKGTLLVVLAPFRLPASADLDTVTIHSAELVLHTCMSGLVFAGFHDFSGRSGRCQ